MLASRFHRYGDESVLQTDEVPTPDPGPGEVLVRVRATAVNHLDLDMRAGTSRIPLELPHTLGMESAGEIAAVGTGVRGVAEGDAVLALGDIVCGRCELCRSGDDNLCPEALHPGWNVPGGYAQYLLLPERGVLALPAGVGYDEAAAAQVAFGTAWHMLITRGRLREGETVVVNAAGSGIGSAAIQISILRGARVIATAGSDQKLHAASEAGAHETINYRKSPLGESILAMTGGRGADLIFEHVGGDIFTESVAALALRGRLVSCGAHAGEVPRIDMIDLFRKEASVIGSNGATQAEVMHCLELVSEGKLRPLVWGSFPLEEAAPAHRAMADRAHTGKIILHP